MGDLHDLPAGACGRLRLWKILTACWTSKLMSKPLPTFVCRFPRGLYSSRSLSLYFRAVDPPGQLVQLFCGEEGHFSFYLANRPR